MIKRYAVIINGDTEPRHLKNVKNAAQTLQNRGYEVFVSPSKKYSDLLEMVQRLKTVLEGEVSPELVIYATGHGTLTQEDGQICFDDGCKGETLGNLLDELPYQNRTLIMDQCYSGNWAKRFTGKPGTLFISLGSANETDSCQEFAPYFWGDDVSDLNEDGIVNWQERFDFAVPHVHRSFPQFIMSEGYEMEGRLPFENRTITVADKRGLDRELEKLKQGQSAVIMFAASWCGACKKFRPYFEKFAAKNKGQRLFLYTEDESLMQLYGGRGFPTLVIVQPFPPDSKGEKYSIRLIENPNNLSGEILEPVLSVKDRISLIRERIKNSKGRRRWDFLRQLEGVVPLASPEELGQIKSSFCEFLEDENENVREAARSLFTKLAEKKYEKNWDQLITDLGLPELQSDIPYFLVLLEMLDDDWRRYSLEQAGALPDTLIPLFEHADPKIAEKAVFLFGVLNGSKILKDNTGWRQRGAKKMERFLYNPDLQWEVLPILFYPGANLSPEVQKRIQEQFLTPYKGKPEEPVVRLMLSMMMEMFSPSARWWGEYSEVSEVNRKRQEELLQGFENEKLQAVAIDLYCGLKSYVDATMIIVFEKLRSVFVHSDRKTALHTVENYKILIRNRNREFVEREALALGDLHKNADSLEVKKLIGDLLLYFPRGILKKLGIFEKIVSDRDKKPAREHAPDKSLIRDGSLGFYMGPDGLSYIGASGSLFFYRSGNNKIGVNGGVGVALRDTIDSEFYLNAYYSRYFERIALGISAGPSLLVGNGTGRLGLHYGADVAYVFENGPAVGGSIFFQSPLELALPKPMFGIFVGVR